MDKREIINIIFEVLKVGIGSLHQMVLEKLEGESINTTVSKTKEKKSVKPKRNLSPEVREARRRRLKEIWEMKQKEKEQAKELAKKEEISTQSKQEPVKQELLKQDPIKQEAVKQEPVKQEKASKQDHVKKEEIKEKIKEVITKKNKVSSVTSSEKKKSSNGPEIPIKHRLILEAFVGEPKQLVEIKNLAQQFFQKNGLDDFDQCWKDFTSKGSTYFAQYHWIGKKTDKDGVPLDANNFPLNEKGKIIERIPRIPYFSAKPFIVD